MDEEAGGGMQSSVIHAGNACIPVAGVLKSCPN